MDLREKLELAEAKDRLSELPVLRRALLRCRWYGAFAGLVLLGSLAALGFAVSEVGFEKEMILPYFLSAGGVLLLVLLLIATRRLVAVSLQADLSSVLPVLKRLKFLLILNIAASLLVEVFNAVMSTSQGGDFNLSEPVKTVLSLALVGFWLKDIHIAEIEVRGKLAPEDSQAISAS